MSTNTTEVPPPSRLGLAAAIGVTSQLISLVLALWATPRLVRGLGDEAYGLLAIIGSFTSYFAYLELGIGGAYVRALSMALAVKDAERAQRLIETAHAIYLRVAAVGTIGMLGIGFPYLTKLAPPAQRYSVWGGLLVLAATFATSMALSTTRAVVIAAQRTDLYARLGLIVQPLIPIAQVVAITQGGGLVALVAIQSAGGVLIDAWMYRIAKQLHPELRVRSRFSSEIWRELRSFSIFRFVAQLAQQGQLTGDRLLVGALVPPSRLAPYAIAASMAQRARVLGIVLTAPFFAAASDYFARSGVDGLVEVTVGFGRRVAALLAIGSAVASFVAYPFLAGWIGVTYADQGTWVLRSLVLATSLLVIAALLGQATDAAGVSRAAAQSSVVGLAVSIVASIPLVSRLGPVGAAHGFLLGSAVQLAGVFIALVSIVGTRHGVAVASATLLLPALVGAGSFLVMRLVPHGSTFVAAIPAATAGAVMGLLLAMALRLLRREDLPARFRRRGA